MLENSHPQQKHKFRKFFSTLLCFWLAFGAVFSSQEAYAIYDNARDVTYRNGRCDAGSLKFNPLDDSNPDVNWEISNPTCMGFVLSAGTAVFVAELLSGALCLQPKHAAEVAAQKAMAIPLTPKMVKRRAKEAAKCTSMLAAQDYVGAGLCCGNLTAAIIATAVAVSALAIIWDQADNAFQNARICGRDWSKWEQQDGVWVKTKGNHVLCLENLFAKEANEQHAGVSGYCENNTSRTITNKSYREFIYGGIEYEDNGCSNPTSWDSNRKKEILGYDDDKQRYYMTGAGNAPVYACYRFRSKVNSEEDREAMQKAFDCCKKRSQETLCIEHKSKIKNDLALPLSEVGLVDINREHKFCKIGSRCTVGDIVYEVYESRKNINYACAKTYSVCPYNHLLSGGTEEKKYDDNDPTKIVNYCQYMNHCAKIPLLPNIYQSDLEGGYISQACRDLKGDSQNVYGYSAQILPINTRGFSAPMAQCFKETMQNIFLHKAGHTKCINPDENPIDDECVSGTHYKRGDNLPGESFFIKIQNSLQDVIKMILIASVIAFGFAILLAVPNMHITKKVLIGYVLKMGLIMYFVIGDAWQYGFVTGIIGSSNLLSDIAFKVDESGANNKLDGCQFPRYNYADDNPATKYNNPQYPPGLEYLRVWDVLDCKIARALGFGPEVSVPNLVLAIVGGFFTGGLGIVFFVATFVFAFFLLSMTIKALHVFIMSITSIIILLYVSPVTITLAFFEKTNNIFKGWLKQLLGFALQPMILFAYLGILVTLLDNIMLGSATFTPSTIEVNGAKIEDTYGRVAPKKISCNGDAKNDSLYCIFRISDIKSFTGFEPLGVGIPILTSMNSEKFSTIFKAAIIMFIFSSFMDKIAEIAATLVGGSQLKSDWGGSGFGMMQKAYEIARGVQDRGVNAANKYLNPITGKGKLTKWGANKAKGVVRAVFDRGKAIAPINKKGGADATSNSKKTDKGSDSTSKDKKGGDAKGSDSTTNTKSKGDANSEKANPDATEKSQPKKTVTGNDDTSSEA